MGDENEFEIVVTVSNVFWGLVLTQKWKFIRFRISTKISDWGAFF